MTDNEIIQRYCEASAIATTAKLRIDSLHTKLLKAEDDMDCFWTMWRMFHTCDCGLTRPGRDCEHERKSNV